MRPIFFVMAMGILAFTVVELLERWRVYLVRKSRRAP